MVRFSFCTYVTGFCICCLIGSNRNIISWDFANSSSAKLAQGSWLSWCYSNLSHMLSLPHSPLPSDRQHPSYGDCLEVKREYYQNSSVLDCVTQCSQSAAHLCEQFLRVQHIGFVTLGALPCA